MATAADTAAPVTDSSGASTGGNTGTVVTLEQLAAIVAGLAGTLATFTSQAQAQLTSLTESVNKIVTASATDSDSGYLVRTSIDPGASQRRLEALAEMSVADAISFRKALDARVLDHFSALPPIAPRSASGPGTTSS